MTPPYLESFQVLPCHTLELLTANGLFEPYLRVAFNARRIPVLYSDHSLSPDELDYHFKALFAARDDLSLDDCQTYNRWVKDAGLFNHPLTSIRAVCTSDKATCKNIRKWTCGGCGMSWLPGSLNDPACTIRDYPWWYHYMEEEITAAIADTGGISKTDALVWVPAGAKRHGRTQNAHPTE